MILHEVIFCLEPLSELKMLANINMDIVVIVLVLIHDWTKNVIIFGVDSSSSTHVNKRTKI